MLRSFAISVLSIALLMPSSTWARDDVIRSQDGVTVTYRDSDSSLDIAMQEKILATFFHAYLNQRKDFNTSAPVRAIITIDPSYDGIAYVSSKDWARMTINPAWLIKHPGDTDLVSHEAMHIVQSYPGYGADRSPVWLVEGIADYARDKYGTDNAAGGWQLPTQVKEEQNYDTGYRVTGAFLKWADSRYPDLVKHLDAKLRSGKYSPSLWNTLTGHNIASLWGDYVAARGGTKPPAN